MIKYIKSVLWRVSESLSYIEDARCLKVKVYKYLCIYSQTKFQILDLVIHWLTLSNQNLQEDINQLKYSDTSANE